MNFVNTIKSVLIVTLLLTFVAGCAAPVLVAAGAGAGATYSLTTDSIKDELDAPKEVLVEKFVEIIREEKGLILFVSVSQGKVRGEINKKRVYLDVEAKDDNTSLVKVRVRKGYQMLPDKDEALSLYKQLLKEVK